MVTTFVRGAVAAAAILAASSAFAGVNLITNGDFSSPNEFGSWSNQGSTWEGWTTSAANGIEIGASSVYGLPSISSGGQNLELDGNTWGTDSYTVTGLTVGETYNLSWGSRVDAGPLRGHRDVDLGDADFYCSRYRLAELRQRVHQRLAIRGPRSVHLGDDGPRLRRPRLRGLSFASPGGRDRVSFARRAKAKAAFGRLFCFLAPSCECPQ